MALLDLANHRPSSGGFEKPDGTRGAGYTGGHYHHNWAIDGVRTMILNTIVWTAGLEVPEGGVKSKKVTEDEINANLDEKKGMKRIKLPLQSPDELIKPMLSKSKKKEKAPKKTTSKKAKSKKASATNHSRPETSKTEPKKWHSLLDQNLTQWDIWMGVPHKSV